jgi:DNA-binding CsgD family transcriptional regulator
VYHRTEGSPPVLALTTFDDEEVLAGMLRAGEREVLALIGRGKTNGEIAAELFVSEGTVKTHINHVFTKLQLRDRAAAVVFAFDHDLVTRD